jgi:hypothetical protein
LCEKGLQTRRIANWDRLSDLVTDFDLLGWRSMQASKKADTRSRMMICTVVRYLWWQQKPEC